MNELRQELERQFKDFEKNKQEQKLDKVQQPSTEETGEETVLSIQIPIGYTEEFAKDFKKLSPKWQKFLSKRESEFQGANEKLKGLHWIDEIFQANYDRLAKSGIKQVREWLEGLAKIDEELNKNPEKTIKALSIVYGLDFDKSTSKKTEVSEEMISRLCKLERGYRELTSYLEKQQNENILEALRAFGRQTDENGKLIHPYFNEVMPEVFKLLQSGVAQDISSAYEKAMWLTPHTREELISKRIDSKVAEAQRAQKAGFSPKGKTKAPERELTLREELEKNMAAFMG